MNINNKENFTPIEENQVFALYRRGKYEHVKALYEKGELYLNTIDNIRSCDDNWQRSDPQDGISYRQFFGDAKVEFCKVGKDIDKEAISLNVQNLTLIKDHKPKGNIYCLSGIYSDHLLGDREEIIFETSGFGESLILIHNPKAFLDRVKNVLMENGYSFEINRIHYYANDYSGDVGLFRKHEKFKAQNETRIYIANEQNQPIKINIGSLTDIATIEKNCLRFTYTDKKQQIMKLL